MSDIGDWWFRCSVLAVGIILLVHMFYFPRWLGWMVSVLLRFFVLPDDTHLSIGAVGLALLSGRIFFRSVRFYTRDFAIRCVDGYVTLWWWRYRSPILDEPQVVTPLGRLSVNLSGLEVLVYNNASRYDWIQQLVSRREQSPAAPSSVSETTTRGENRRRTERQSSSHGPSDTKSKKQILSTPPDEIDDKYKFSQASIPWIFKWLSNIAVFVTKGCLMIGNFQLQRIALLSFSRCTALVSAEIAPVLFDPYRLISNAELLNAELSFLENPDHSKDKIGDRLEEKELAFLKVASLELKKFFRGIRNRFLKRRDAGFSADGAEQHRFSANGETSQRIADEMDRLSFIEQARRHMFEESDVFRRTDAWSMHTAEFRQETDRNDQGHIPEDPNTFHAVRNELPILSCSRMRLAFKMDMNLTDVPLPQNEEFPPPLQSLAIRFSNTSIWYGPEHDQYRTELMSFFLPNTYEDLPVISEESARYRHASCFFVDISFEGDAVQAIIPFLDSSPSLSSETKNRQVDSKPAQHSLHCVMSSKTSIRVVYPYDVLPHQRVSSTDIRFSLHELVVRSSLNDAVLVQSKSTKGCVFMDYAVVWNRAGGGMRINLDFQDPRIFYLDSHLIHFLALAADWTSRSTPPDLAQFTPWDITLRAKLSDFSVYAHVNEYNVIDKPCDLDENAFLVLDGSLLEFEIRLPWKKPKPYLNEYKFSIKSTKNVGTLSLPSSSHLHESFHPNTNTSTNYSSTTFIAPSRRNTRSHHFSLHPKAGNNTCRVLACDEILFRGSYLVHTAFEPSSLKKDSCTLEVTVENIVCDFFGSNFSYVLNLCYNYFGSYRRCMKLYEFLQNGMKNDFFAREVARLESSRMSIGKDTDIQSISSGDEHSLHEGYQFSDVSSLEDRDLEVVVILTLSHIRISVPSELHSISGSSIVQCARYSLEARASDTILEICMDTSPISLFLVSPNSDGMYGVSADVRSRVSEQTTGRPPFPRKHFREKGARSKRGKGPRDHLHSFSPSSDSTHSHTLPEKDACSSASYIAFDGFAFDIFAAFGPGYTVPYLDRSRFKLGSCTGELHPVDIVTMLKLIDCFFFHFGLPRHKSEIMFLPAQSFDPALNESISSTNLAESSSHPNGMGLGKDDTKREDFREGGFSLTPAISRSEVFYDLRHRRSSGIISTPNSLLFHDSEYDDQATERVLEQDAIENMEDTVLSLNRFAYRLFAVEVDYLNLRCSMDGNQSIFICSLPEGLSLGSLNHATRLYHSSFSLTVPHFDTKHVVLFRSSERGRSGRSKNPEYAICSSLTTGLSVSHFHRYPFEESSEVNATDVFESSMKLELKRQNEILSHMDRLNGFLSPLLLDRDEKEGFLVDSVSSLRFPVRAAEKTGFRASASSFPTNSEVCVGYASTLSEAVWKAKSSKRGNSSFDDVSSAGVHHSKNKRTLSSSSENMDKYTFSELVSPSSIVSGANQDAAQSVKESSLCTISVQQSLLDSKFDQGDDDADSSLSNDPLASFKSAESSLPIELEFLPQVRELDSTESDYSLPDDDSSSNSMVIHDSDPDASHSVHYWDSLRRDDFHTSFVSSPPSSEESTHSSSEDNESFPEDLVNNSSESFKNVSGSASSTRLRSAEDDERLIHYETDFFSPFSCFDSMSGAQERSFSFLAQEKAKRDEEWLLQEAVDLEHSGDSLGFRSYRRYLPGITLPNINQTYPSPLSPRIGNSYIERIEDRGSSYRSSLSTNQSSHPPPSNSRPDDSSFRMEKNSGLSRLFGSLPAPPLPHTSAPSVLKAFSKPPYRTNPAEVIPRDMIGYDQLSLEHHAAERGVFSSGVHFSDVSAPFSLSPNPNSTVNPPVHRLQSSVQDASQLAAYPPLPLPHRLSEVPLPRSGLNPVRGRTHADVRGYRRVLAAMQRGAVEVGWFSMHPGSFSHQKGTKTRSPLSSSFSKLSELYRSCESDLVNPAESFASRRRPSTFERARKEIRSQRSRDLSSSRSGRESDSPMSVLDVHPGFFNSHVLSIDFLTSLNVFVSPTTLSTVTEIVSEPYLDSNVRGILDQIEIRLRSSQNSQLSAETHRNSSKQSTKNSASGSDLDRVTTLHQSPGNRMSSTTVERQVPPSSQTRDTFKIADDDSSITETHHSSVDASGTSVSICVSLKEAQFSVIQDASPCSLVDSPLQHYSSSMLSVSTSSSQTGPIQSESSSYSGREDPFSLESTLSNVHALEPMVTRTSWKVFDVYIVSSATWCSSECTDGEPDVRLLETSGTIRFGGADLAVQRLNHPLQPLNPSLREKGFSLSGVPIPNSEAASVYPVLFHWSSGSSSVLWSFTSDLDIVQFRQGSFGRQPAGAIHGGVSVFLPPIEIATVRETPAIVLGCIKIWIKECKRLRDRLRHRRILGRWRERRVISFLSTFFAFREPLRTSDTASSLDILLLLRQKEESIASQLEKSWLLNDLNSVSKIPNLSFDVASWCTDSSSSLYRRWVELFPWVWLTEGDKILDGDRRLIHRLSPPCASSEDFDNIDDPFDIVLLRLDNIEKQSQVDGEDRENSDTAPEDVVGVGGDPHSRSFSQSSATNTAYQGFLAARTNLVNSSDVRCDIRIRVSSLGCHVYGSVRKNEAGPENSIIFDGLDLETRAIYEIVVASQGSLSTSQPRGIPLLSSRQSHSVSPDDIIMFEPRAVFSAHFESFKVFVCPGILSLGFLASKSLEDFSSSLEESKDENQFTLINIPEFLKHRYVPNSVSSVLNDPSTRNDRTVSFSDGDDGFSRPTYSSRYSSSRSRSVRDLHRSDIEQPHTESMSIFNEPAVEPGNHSEIGLLESNPSISVPSRNWRGFSVYEGKSRSLTNSDSAFRAEYSALSPFHGRNARKSDDTSASTPSKPQKHSNPVDFGGTIYGNILLFSSDVIELEASENEQERGIRVSLFIVKIQGSIDFDSLEISGHVPQCGVSSCSLNRVQLVLLHGEDDQPLETSSSPLLPSHRHGDRNQIGDASWRVSSFVRFHVGEVCVDYTMEDMSAPIATSIDADKFSRIKSRRKMTFDARIKDIDFIFSICKPDRSSDGHIMLKSSTGGVSDALSPNARHFNFLFRFVGPKFNVRDLKGAISSLSRIVRFLDAWRFLSALPSLEKLRSEYNPMDSREPDSTSVFFPSVRKNTDTHVRWDFGGSYSGISSTSSSSPSTQVHMMPSDIPIPGRARHPPTDEVSYVGSSPAMRSKSNPTIDTSSSFPDVVDQDHSKPHQSFSFSPGSVRSETTVPNTGGRGMSVLETVTVMLHSTAVHDVYVSASIEISGVELSTSVTNSLRSVFGVSSITSSLSYQSSRRRAAISVGISDGFFSFQKSASSPYFRKKNSSDHDHLPLSSSSSIPVTDAYQKDFMFPRLRAGIQFFWEDLEFTYNPESALSLDVKATSVEPRKRVSSFGNKLEYLRKSIFRSILNAQVYLHVDRIVSFFSADFLSRMFHVYSLVVSDLNEIAEEGLRFRGMIHRENNPSRGSYSGVNSNGLDSELRENGHSISSKQTSTRGIFNHSKSNISVGESDQFPSHSSAPKNTSIATEESGDLYIELDDQTVLLPLLERLNLAFEFSFGGIEIGLQCLPVAMIYRTGDISLGLNLRSNPVFSYLERNKENGDRKSTLSRLLWKFQANDLSISLIDANLKNLDQSEGTDKLKAAWTQDTAKCVRWMCGGMGLTVKNFFEKDVSPLRIPLSISSKKFAFGASMNLWSPVWKRSFLESCNESYARSDSDTRSRFLVEVKNPTLMLRREAPYFLTYLFQYLDTEWTLISSKLREKHEDEEFNNLVLLADSGIDRAKALSREYQDKMIQDVEEISQDRSFLLQIPECSLIVPFGIPEKRLWETRNVHCLILRTDIIQVSGIFRRLSLSENDTGTSGSKKSRSVFVNSCDIQRMQGRIAVADLDFSDRMCVSLREKKKEGDFSNSCSIDSLQAKIRFEADEDLKKVNVIINVDSPNISFDSKAVSQSILLVGDWRDCMNLPLHARPSEGFASTPQKLMCFARLAFQRSLASRLKMAFLRDRIIDMYGFDIRGMEASEDNIGNLLNESRLASECVRDREENMENRDAELNVPNDEVTSKLDEASSSEKQLHSRSSMASPIASAWHIDLCIRMNSGKIVLFAGRNQGLSSRHSQFKEAEPVLNIPLPKIELMLRHRSSLVQYKDSEFQNMANSSVDGSERGSMAQRVLESDDARTSEMWTNPLSFLQEDNHSLRLETQDQLSSSKSESILADSIILLRMNSLSSLEITPRILLLVEQSKIFLRKLLQNDRLKRIAHLSLEIDDSYSPPNDLAVYRVNKLALSLQYSCLRAKFRRTAKADTQVARTYLKALYDDRRLSRMLSYCLGDSTSFPWKTPEEVWENMHVVMTRFQQRMEDGVITFDDIQSLRANLPPTKYFRTAFDNFDVDHRISRSQDRSLFPLLSATPLFTESSSEIASIDHSDDDLTDVSDDAGDALGTAGLRSGEQSGDRTPSAGLSSKEHDEVLSNAVSPLEEMAHNLGNVIFIFEFGSFKTRLFTEQSQLVLEIAAGSETKPALTSVACLGSKLDSFSLNSCSLTFPIFSLRLRESSQILNKTETGFAVQDVSFHIQSVSVSKVLGPRPLTKAALREVSVDSKISDPESQARTSLSDSFSFGRLNFQHKTVSEQSPQFGSFLSGGSNSRSMKDSGSIQTSSFSKKLMELRKKIVFCLANCSTFGFSIDLDDLSKIFKFYNYWTFKAMEVRSEFEKLTKGMVDDQLINPLNSPYPIADAKRYSVDDVPLSRLIEYKLLRNESHLLYDTVRSLGVARGLAPLFSFSSENDIWSRSLSFAENGENVVERAASLKRDDTLPSKKKVHRSSHLSVYQQRSSSNRCTSVVWNVLIGVAGCMSRANVLGQQQGKLEGLYLNFQSNILSGRNSFDMDCCLEEIELFLPSGVGEHVLSGKLLLQNVCFGLDHKVLCKEDALRDGEYFDISILPITSLNRFTILLEKAWGCLCYTSSGELLRIHAGQQVVKFRNSLRDTSAPLLWDQIVALSDDLSIFISQQSLPVFVMIGCQVLQLVYKAQSSSLESAMSMLMKEADGTSGDGSKKGNIRTSEGLSRRFTSTTLSRPPEEWLAFIVGEGSSRNSREIGKLLPVDKSPSQVLRKGSLASSQLSAFDQETEKSVVMGNVFINVRKFHVGFFPVEINFGCSFYSLDVDDLVVLYAQHHESESEWDLDSLLDVQVGNLALRDGLSRSNSLSSSRSYDSPDHIVLVSSIQTELIQVPDLNIRLNLNFAARNVNAELYTDTNAEIQVCTNLNQLLDFKSAVMALFESLNKRYEQESRRVDQAKSLKSALQSRLSSIFMEDHTAESTLDTSSLSSSVHGLRYRNVSTSSLSPSTRPVSTLTSLSARPNRSVEACAPSDYRVHFSVFSFNPQLKIVGKGLSMITSVLEYLGIDAKKHVGGFVFHALNLPMKSLLEGSHDLVLSLDAVPRSSRSNDVEADREKDK